MLVHIILGEQLEQASVNSVLNNQAVQNIVNKIVNPTLVFKSAFIPGAIDIAIIVATVDIDTSIEHNAVVSVRKKGSSDLLATTTPIPLPVNLFKGEDGLNLNVEFKKVIVRTEGEYEVVFSLDDDETIQSFFVKGVEVL